MGDLVGREGFAGMFQGERVLKEPQVRLLAGECLLPVEALAHQGGERAVREILFAGRDYFTLCRRTYLRRKTWSL